MSIEATRATAIDRARVQALADEYGTLVDQRSSTLMKNANGESSINYLTLGESTVKGEWLADIKEPLVIESFEDGFFMVTAKVCGKAIEIVSAPIDMSVKILKNGTSSRFQDNQFRNGDDMFLSFQSPVSGFLAVYLMDDKGEAYCLLPYAGDTDGKFVVRANKPYVLFSEQHAEKGELCDEYILTCDKEVE
ncbi:MAG: hypothetical protein ACTTKO_06545 [Candidatus Limimorpha sp.]